MPPRQEPGRGDQRHGQIDHRLVCVERPVHAATERPDPNIAHQKSRKRNRVDQSSVGIDGPAEEADRQDRREIPRIDGVGGVNRHADGRQCIGDEPSGDAQGDQHEKDHRSRFHGRLTPVLRRRLGEKRLIKPPSGEGGRSYSVVTVVRSATTSYRRWRRIACNASVLSFPPLKQRMIDSDMSVSRFIAQRPNVTRPPKTTDRGNPG